MAAVSKALLLLLVSAAAAMAVAKADLDETIKTDCGKTKEPKVCVELLQPHPEIKIDGKTTTAELAMQVTAKIARETDSDARSIMKDMPSPTPCLVYCVRDICAAAQRVAWIPDVLADADWTKLEASLKTEVTWTCGKSCPEKPGDKEQAVQQKFTELKRALCVAKDLVQTRNGKSAQAPGQAPAPAPQ